MPKQPKLYDPKEISEITGLAKRKNGKQVMRKLLFDYSDIVKPTGHKNYPPDGREGYKLYDADAVDKLRQIVIYRELGLRHGEIKAIYSDPAYDPNQALSDLLTSLKEKREQINEQIEAVEQMQAIGVKNGVLQLIWPHVSIKDFLERRYSPVSQSVDAMIESIKADDARLDEFLSKIEPIGTAYAQLDDSLCESPEGMDLIESMISMTKQTYGFIGYTFWICFALCVHGDGTMWHDFIEGLDNLFSDQKCQAISHWMLQDAKDFDAEVKSLARQYNCIGLPFQHKRSVTFVSNVKLAAQKHFSLETVEEYMLIFSTMDLPPYKAGDGYASYTLNALKNDMNS